MTITVSLQNEINSFQFILPVHIHVSYNTEILSGCRKQLPIHLNYLRFCFQDSYSSIFLHDIYFLQRIAVCGEKLLISFNFFQSTFNRNHSMYKRFEALTMVIMSNGDTMKCDMQLPKFGRNVLTLFSG